MEYLGTTPRRYAGPVICFVGDCPSRDEPDYNLLMLNRMKILNQHGLKLHDIQQVISQICHMLVMDETNRITGYTLRQPDPRRNTVEALQGLKYQVIAMGYPYNDISILQQADVGILFRPPQNVINDYPGFPVITDYGELKVLLGKYIPV